MEMMKERFSKLLLGEDMSGSGKGVCTALAISNAITNLCGTYVIHHLASFANANVGVVGWSLAARDQLLSSSTRNHGGVFNN
jgi:hypothetical protein